MKIFLSEERKKELEKMHGESRDKRVCDRIKAVLLASEGWNTAMISQALRISKSTVDRHIKDYLNLDKLKPENGGSESHLSVSQTMELIQHLEDVTYHQTSHIVAYVLVTYGIQYTVAGMNKWLHRNGFSYKKPKGVPHKFCETKQAEFIEFYEQLKASKADDEAIVFIDAVHPSQATKLSNGWIRKGKKKFVETTGSRTRVNVIGALNLNDIANTIVSFEDTINERSVCLFFDKLRKHYPAEKKLHIILDGAAYNKSQLVQEFAYVYNIELHYLPSYSPNLNPIERLWKVMNEYARNNIYFESKGKFVSAIKRFFEETLPSISDILKTQLTDNFQILKSAS